MAEEIELEKCNFRNFTYAVTLTLNRVTRHTIMHRSSTSIHTHQISLKSDKLFVDGRTDGRTYLLTDGHFPFNVIRSTRRSRPNKVKPNEYPGNSNVAKFSVAEMNKSFQNFTKSLKIPGSVFRSHPYSNKFLLVLRHAVPKIPH